MIRFVRLTTAKQKKVPMTAVWNIILLDASSSHCAAQAVRHWMRDGAGSGTVGVCSIRPRNSVKSGGCPPALRPSKP